MDKNEEIKKLGEIFPHIGLHHLLALWYKEKGDSDRMLDVLLNIDNMSNAGRTEFFQELDAFVIPPEDRPAAPAPAVFVPEPAVVPEPAPAPEPIVPEPIVPEPIVVSEPAVFVPEPIVPEPAVVPEPIVVSEPEKKKLNISSDKNVHRLLASFENQLAVNYSEQERSIVPSEMSHSPKVQIIKDRSSESAERSQTLIDMFLELGLQREDIRVISSSSDPEIMDLIKKESKDDFPIVRLYSTHYFGFQEFVREAEAGSVSKIITETEFKSSGDFYGQTFLDVVADGTNSLFFNLAWFAALPITLPFSYFFGSKPLELKPGEIDFNVVHTNWYRRNLKQKMRFGKDQFYRMDSDGHSILIAHAYSSIAFITILSPSYFFITYKPEAGCSSDYLSASPSDCEEMLRLISTRCQAIKHEIKISHFTDQVAELTNQPSSSSSSSVVEAPAAEIKQEEAKNE
eukprot:CAMPEP_0184335468 /NCGR_PEP_ID=MMETSP1089-20130417/4027_1 /TAXON_ID=38269 ORGANISM="Gloeochaete wittrockiana, Strain SAG46.84" /NCGR_SAMPLE_ID=MMETSP1089 /ASSEMBLY_ACC=CAM_ASM_000445 /LENGTH=456 /DNA_ID=CAMNT_0026660129 /DNA_START=106 /DNA_END=1476 /DNA_ORIENTATION=+